MLIKVQMYSCQLAHGDESTEGNWYQFRPADPMDIRRQDAALRNRTTEVVAVVKERWC